MKKYQVDRVVERVKIISGNKIKKFEISLKKKPVFTVEEKVRFIKNKKAKLAPPKKMDHFTSVINCFTYPGENEIKKHNIACNKKLRAYTEKINSKAELLIDEIILGDPEQAIAKIRDFEQAEVKI